MYYQEIRDTKDYGGLSINCTFSTKNGILLMSCGLHAYLVYNRELSTCNECKYNEKQQASILEKIATEPHSPHSNP